MLTTIPIFHASPNQIQLVSRDEQSVLIVTYAELKHCLEQAFAELVASAQELS